MTNKKRDMYNMGGLSAHKTVGDLDLSMSVSGTDDYQRAGVGATYENKPKGLKFVVKYLQINLVIDHHLFAQVKA